MRRFVLHVAAIVMMVGCADPKIDTSTDENMKASINKVRESLPEDQRPEFDESMQVLAFSQLSLKDVMADGATGGDTTKTKMKASLEGKTGTEVIAEANRLRAERKEKERQQALMEISELEKKQADAEAAKGALGQFVVLRSRFYLQKQMFGRAQPGIDLTVKNETGRAVSRAYFLGTVSSPGRSVPWIQEQFNYPIPGGIEPGEQASWSLAPNMFSAWGKVEIPSGAVMTVDVERLDGADGEPFASALGFSESDAKRLSDLKSQYAD